MSEKSEIPLKAGDLVEIEALAPGAPKRIPVALELLSAGFASPAQDFIEKSVDLNEMLITNEYSTFIGKVGSRSMLNAGIDINDKLIIDRSLDAKHLDIIVAQLETDFTVKRLMITKQMSASEINEIFGPDAKSIPPVWLKAENQEHSHIFLKPEQELIVWGVVTYIIKDARK